jgi:PAS domain S-box-containing protein
MTPVLYELILQSVTDYAIFMLDAEGNVLSWNPGAARVKGYEASDIIGQHFSRFYTEEDRFAGVPTRALEQARQTGRFAAEGWRVKKDGTRFWASVVIDRVVQSGQVVGFVKVTRDMTEQRVAQLATLEAERRFRLLVQGVTDYAIYMLDPEGHVTNWNVGAARIKGYSQEEILGQHFSRFYTPEDIDDGTPRRALERARTEGRYETEGWRVRKDGTQFWASVVLDAIHDENGELIGFAKITRDLTERRATQLELEKSREQLFQSQKMEAIGQLTGGLAHDFNNLLTGITGNLDLIAARIAQGRMRDLDRYVGAAKGAASRAAALTHRLLAFARRQTLDPKPTDANKLITEMVEMIQRTVGPEITIEAVLAAGAWPALCDANQLENAILNLCINARDAMPDGGRLMIETANTWLDERAARERDMAPGQYLAVSVTDTGTGMPPDVVTRAFDPFFTTKPAGQGTGLGLSMIYGFARQSGGHTRIYSEVEQGTTVRIYLPRYFGEVVEEQAESGAPEVSNEHTGKVVLVVDDEPTVRMLVVEVGEDLGCATLEAADGAAGLKLLESDMRIDLLVTDVGLPGGMNGRKLADAATAKRPELKVLFITGYAENAAIGNGHLEPGMQVLTKPFAVEALAQRMRRILSPC